MDFNANRDYWAIEVVDEGWPPELYECGIDAARGTSGTVKDWQLVAFTTERGAEQFAIGVRRPKMTANPKKLAGAKVLSHLQPDGKRRGSLLLDGVPCSTSD